MFKKVSLFSLSLFLVVLALITAGTSAGASSGTQKFIVSIDNVAHFRYTDSGAYNTPVGSGGPGPLLPGQAYQWSFYANPGENLSFANMFVQSNDWFIAPDENGIPLYNGDGSQKSGDVTSYVKLWDAGTEADQKAGAGADQAPRQSGANSGAADPNRSVRQVLDGGLPSVADLVRVTIDAGGNGRFTLRVENKSGGSSLATPFAPGVGVVHSNAAPLFVNGTADWGAGLEALAEDGNPSGLAASLKARTGINTPLAPAAWVVDSRSNVLFTSGAAASAGLEALAEDGGPGKLVAEIKADNKGAAAIARGASGPGPIFAPSGNFSFEITAAPGDKISLATMFVQSNDWFFGLNNLPLWDGSGNPINGNVTHHVKLYEAGTEVDQTPGFGSNQPVRQSGPNSGASQGGVVSPIGATSPANVVHITITPVN